MFSVVEQILGYLTASTATVFFICAAVLWIGGWYHREHKPTHLQRAFSIGFFIVSVDISLYYVEAILHEGSPFFKLFLDWMAYIPIAAPYVISHILRQNKLTWKHYLVSFGPIALDLPLVLIFGNAYTFAVQRVGYFIYVYCLVLYVITLVQLANWDHNIENEFSDITHKQTVWFRHLTLPFMLLILLWIPQTFMYNGEWLWCIYWIAASVLVILITDNVLKQEEFELSISPDDNQDATDAAGSPAWVQKLEEAMTEEHIYRQPDLTMSVLAQHIGANRTYLSHYINTETGGTFYDYINSYRLREAEQLLTQTHMPLAMVAENCGFSCASVFSRAFHAKYHQTPSEFRRTNGGKD